MGNYITIASVRRTCGIQSTEINDTDVEAVITEVEKQAPRELKTAFTPTEKIDILNGNGTNRIFARKSPLLTLKALKIEGTDVTIDGNVLVYKESGKIELDNINGSPEKTSFTDQKQQVAIKFLYGWMEESSTSTATTAATTDGTSVAISVSDESDFSEDDWVEVIGMDGNVEVAQVSSTATSTITVDALYRDHESGSTVTKLQTNTNFTKLMNIIASLSCVARIVGESYTDIVGYNLSELHVQKGEPYTQWRETATQLIHERDRLMKIIKPRAVIGSTG